MSYTTYYICLCESGSADQTSAAPMVVAATETVGEPVTSGAEPEGTAPAGSASDAAEDACAGDNSPANPYQHIDIGDTTRNLAATFDAADSEAEDDATGESALDPSGLCNHDGEVRQDENEHG
ncbi:hypothetical protein GN244_ATG16680 [Phytophthora infestans]|uniref:Uncharacterized protein n=1 Tax=Phytophthora infestans TaxID=4787 RepID=A0A833SQ09_PHYIN|nr:hypothetical protein GN244_ATG16680 [Phytophthora infestans]